MGRRSIIISGPTVSWTRKLQGGGEGGLRGEVRMARPGTHPPCVGRRPPEHEVGCPGLNFSTSSARSSPVRVLAILPYTLACSSLFSVVWPSCRPQCSQLREGRTPCICHEIVREAPQSNRSDPKGTPSALRWDLAFLQPFSFLSL